MAFRLGPILLQKSSVSGAMACFWRPCRFAEHLLCGQLRLERRPLRLHRDAGHDCNRVDASHNALDRCGRRWASNQFAETPQVLGDGRQGELEVSPARAPQSQPAEPQDTLQVGEQHFDLLAIPARLGKLLCPGECTGNVAGFLVRIAWHLALWR